MAHVHEHGADDLVKDALRERNLMMTHLIARDRSRQEAELYNAYELTDLGPVQDAAREMLRNVPSFGPGECTSLSTHCATYLRKHMNIPAIVVAGDLNLYGRPLYRCSTNLPLPTADKDVIVHQWKGHCWIEIGGIIGDLSIFRTAYSLDNSNELKQYVMSWVGPGKGACLLHAQEPPPGLEYVPKYVLTDEQIDACIAGVKYRSRLGNDATV